MVRWQHRLINLFLLLVILLPLFHVRAAPARQGADPAAQARDYLDRLSPEEKVGQLFLVTFSGQEVGPDSQIHDLISNYHIGGVILQGANGNFSNGDKALEDLLQMVRNLQASGWPAAQDDDEGTPEPADAEQNYIPLFVGLSQESDGYPFDQILDGMTPLPNQMAIGATWNPDIATRVGEVLGLELSALGINLLIGPSLDVLEAPGAEDANDLGTRSFGGDPFWVGEMGQAYIRGVHSGSQGQVAVVAKHFPGNGGADRLPEEEVATVRKSLEELKNFDLAPFFSVTGNAPNAESTVDALLASHIRYQGFQENIRATTRPISFDPEAFNQLMSLPALTTWRENGGIMISDNLGSQAVRRFYELTGQPYDAERAARSAFIAGNDLLYLGNVTSGEDPDSYTSTVRVLQAFAKKYRDDPAFAQQVDASVARILTLKFKLFQDFALERALPSPQDLAVIGQATQVTFEVARQAASLISPTLAELDVTVPDPPNLNDRIIFITDERTAALCPTCQPQTVFERDAFQRAVTELYGPRGSGQIIPTNLSSYTFTDLKDMLDGTKTDTAVESDLRRAHWIVFAMLNISDQAPESDALRRFLSERPDLFQQKRLIVFAFNAPYYLDATNISKITAYYGLYGKSPSFVDVAARLLFREIRPVGALPVSVSGIGYDLITATSPNPAQVIPLFVDTPLLNQPEETETPQTPAPQIPQYREGDLIPIRTGTILDHNGHPVPDGTPVQFKFSTGGVEYMPPREETTIDGVARTTLQATSAGPLEIWVESELARSDILRFEIRSKTGEVVTITPTPQPTFTPTPSPTPSPTVTPTLAVETPPEPPTGKPELVDWIIALALSAGTGFFAFRLAASFGSVRWAARAGLLALIGGLLAYTYLALDMPGTGPLLGALGSWGTVMTSLLGALVGILATWIWRSATTGSPKLRMEP